MTDVLTNPIVTSILQDKVTTLYILKRTCNFMTIFMFGYLYRVHIWKRKHVIGWDNRLTVEIHIFGAYPAGNWDTGVDSTLW